MAQLVPDPLAAIVRARNASRISRRAAVAALAQSVARQGFQSFTRTPSRTIGGQFEELETVPEPRLEEAPGQLPQDTVNRIFELFRFQGQQQVIPRGRQVISQQPGPNQFLARFGGGFGRFFQPNRFLRFSETNQAASRF